jgi:hypothetical protein
VFLAAREAVLRTVKLLRSEVPAGVSSTLNFTSCESTVLRGGTAVTSLGKAKLREI